MIKKTVILSILCYYSTSAMHIIQANNLISAIRAHDYPKINEILIKSRDRIMLINAKDKNGWNALHWAVYGYNENVIMSDDSGIFVRTDEKIIKLFLNLKGVDITAQTTTSLNILHIALYMGNCNLLKFLLNELIWLIILQNIKPVNERFINASDAKGETPLHVASKMGNQKLVQLLLSSGADCTIIDNAKKLPIDYARLQANQAIITTLEAAMAKHHIKQRLLYAKFF